MAVTQNICYCCIDTNIPADKGHPYFGENFSVTYKYNNATYVASVGDPTESGYDFSLGFDDVGDNGAKACGSFLPFNPFTDEDTEFLQLVIMSRMKNIQNVESIVSVRCGAQTYLIDYDFADIVKSIVGL